MPATKRKSSTQARPSGPKLRPGQTYFEDYFESAPTIDADLKEDQYPAGMIAKITGVAAKTNIINLNDRFYSDEEFRSSIRALKTDFAEGGFLGQVDHPDWAGSLRKAAIKFTAMSVVEDPTDPGHPVVTYEGYVIDNDEGRHLKSLLVAGVRVGMSTRAVGTVSIEKVGDREDIAVIKELELRGLDAVLNPSNKWGRNHTHESEGDDVTMPEKITLETLQESAPAVLTQVRDTERLDTIKDLNDAAFLIATTLLEKSDHAELAAIHDRHETHIKGARDAHTEMHKKAMELCAKEATEKVIESQVKPLQSKVDEAMAAVTKLTADKTALEAEVAALKPLAEKYATMEAENAKAKAVLDRQKLIDEAINHADNARIKVPLTALLSAIKPEEPVTAETIARCVETAGNIAKGMGAKLLDGEGHTKPQDKEDLTKKPEPKAQKTTADRFASALGYGD